VTYKQKAHGSLDAVIHSCAKNHKNYIARIDLPYHELMRELGFGDSEITGNLRITITAGFIDEDEANYERETSSSSKD
jgi:hypothetical protein